MFRKKKAGFPPRPERRGFQPARRVKLILNNLLAKIVSHEWRVSPTGVKEWHFEIKDGEWRIAGFTRNVNAEDFDIDAENKLVLKCKEKILEILKNPNKFEKRLARMVGVPLDNPKRKELYNNVLFVNDDSKFCWGVGGVGGGKVYWTPYTSRNEWKNNIINADLECDNCRVLAHEDLHGIGSHAELDYLSKLIGIYFRFENLPEEEWGWDIKWNISLWATRAEAYADGKKTRETRIGRNAFCAVYTRYPEETRKVLEAEGLSEERIRKAISVCK